MPNGSSLLVCFFANEAAVSAFYLTESAMPGRGEGHDGTSCASSRIAGVRFVTAALAAAFAPHSVSGPDGPVKLFRRNTPCPRNLPPCLCRRRYG